MAGPLGRRTPTDWRHYEKFPLTAATTPATPTPVAIGVNWYTEFDEPEITYERERKTLTVPNRTVTRQTATLKKGVTKIAQPGRPGLRVKVFRLTLEDGVEVMGGEFVVM